MQDRVSAFARVCSYDRAGLGWSDPTGAPRSLDNIVSELRALLCDAAIPAPYILVGHSFGALVARQFWRLSILPKSQVSCSSILCRSRNGSPLIPAQRARLGRGVKLSRRGALLAQFGVVRLALSLLISGSRTIPKLLALLLHGRKGAAVTNNLTREVRKLPREVWPMVAAQWSLPKSFRGMADYLEALPANAAAVRDTQQSAGHGYHRAPRNAGATSRRHPSHRVPDRSLDPTRRTGPCGECHPRSNRAYLYAVSD